MAISLNNTENTEGQAFAIGRWPSIWPREHGEFLVLVAAFAETLRSRTLGRVIDASRVFSTLPYSLINQFLRQAQSEVSSPPCLFDNSEDLTLFILFIAPSERFPIALQRQGLNHPPPFQWQDLNLVSL